MQYFRILKIVGDRPPFLAEGKVYMQEDIDRFGGSTPLKLQRVYINNAYPSDGTEETGENIIKALEALGGINDRGFRGFDRGRPLSVYYYINAEGFIRIALTSFEGMLLNPTPKKVN